MDQECVSEGGRALNDEMLCEKGQKEEKKWQSESE